MCTCIQVYMQIDINSMAFHEYGAQDMSMQRNTLSPRLLHALRPAYKCLWRVCAMRRDVSCVCDV